jgi:hypothetical protein
MPRLSLNTPSCRICNSAGRKIPLLWRGVRRTGWFRRSPRHWQSLRDFNPRLPMENHILSDLLHVISFWFNFYYRLFAKMTGGATPRNGDDHYPPPVLPNLQFGSHAYKHL